MMLDNDFHRVEPDRRLERPPSAPDHHRGQRLDRCPGDRHSVGVTIGTPTAVSAPAASSLRRCAGPRTLGRRCAGARAIRELEHLTSGRTVAHGRLRPRADPRAHHPRRQPPRRSSARTRPSTRCSCRDPLRGRPAWPAGCPGYGNWTVRAGLPGRRAIRAAAPRRDGSTPCSSTPRSRRSSCPIVLRRIPDRRLARRHADPVRRARRPLRPRRRRNAASSA